MTKRSEPDSFELRGSYSQDRLELRVFDYRDQPRYVASVTVGDAEAKVHVWLSQPDLAAFVAGMARDWQGWDGYREFAGFAPGTTFPRLLLRASTSGAEGRVRIDIAAGFPSLADGPGPLDGIGELPQQAGSWKLAGVIEWDAFQYGGEVATKAASLQALPAWQSD